MAAHILHCEDVMINSVIQGKPSIWERDGWDKKLGIAAVALDQLADSTDVVSDARVARRLRALVTG